MILFGLSEKAAISYVLYMFNLCAKDLGQRTGELSIDGCHLTCHAYK
jgi:hypothetical protein